MGTQARVLTANGGRRQSQNWGSGSDDEIFSLQVRVGSGFLDQKGCRWLWLFSTL